MVQCIFSLLCELFYNPRDVVGLLGDCAADFAPWDVAIGEGGFKFDEKPFNVFALEVRAYTRKVATRLRVLQ